LVLATVLFAAAEESEKEILLACFDFLIASTALDWLACFAFYCLVNSWHAFFSSFSGGSVSR